MSPKNIICTVIKLLTFCIDIEHVVVCRVWLLKRGQSQEVYNPERHITEVCLSWFYVPLTVCARKALHTNM